MKLIKLLFFFLLIFSSSNADAGDYSLSSLWGKFKHNTSETWKNPDGYDVFVPFTMWHNRLTYDKEHLEKYNEEPWGIGFGMTRYDEDGDSHSLFAVGFKDSNFYAQTIAGYAYQKNWYFDNAENWLAGAGFILSLTQRHEYSYIPVPLPLPAFSLGHKNFMVQMAYVPGIKNDGNVAFFWTKIEF
ncbi:MAG: lipid IV(A) palmitoyltransferase PagP [Lactobacillaceae bacterium]|jgi:palmitoyl transferase|nr:lipid IV(A) palmitoyltransferase PagP [Lactobacillaceae bacterium]